MATAKIILTFVAFMYHGNGDVESKPPQSIEFADKASCEEMRVTLLKRNWDNPFPLPAGVKVEDYQFSRYQVGPCAEPKAKAENAPAEDKQP